MTNLRKDLELIEVKYEDNKQKAVMTFLDLEQGEVLEVNFNKNIYDPEKNEYVADEKKSEEVEEWCEEYFGCTFNELGSKIGEKRDVYTYDRFNSLWAVDYVSKFEKEDEGQIIETIIKDVEDDGIAIRIKFEFEDKTYESKMTYAKYVEELQKWFNDPQKKNRQYEKFKDKFGVSVKNADKIIGKPIMVEVKVAFGKYPYADIKKPRWDD